MAGRFSHLTIAMMLAVITAGSALAAPQSDGKHYQTRENLDHPADDLGIWIRNLLIDPRLESNPESIRAIYARYGIHDAPRNYYVPSGAEALDYKRTGSLFSFMLRRNFTDYRHLLIPIVQRRDRGLIAQHAYVTRYDAGPFAGESRLGAAIKGQEEADVAAGFIEQDLPDNEILSQGVFSSLNYGLPRNGSLYDPAAWSLRSLPAFLGFESSLGGRNGNVRNPNPTPLDQHLYAKGRGKLVENLLTGEEFASLASYDSPSALELSFEGEHVRAFLSRQEGWDRLPVRLSGGGYAYLGLRHTLLSDDSYINYGTYVEPELEVMRDLGYDIRPREFIGQTVMSNGREDAPVRTEITSGFYSYSDRTGGYDVTRSSEVPFGVGTHIMGDYNDVTQTGGIFSTGMAGIGVRVDGTGNRFVLPSHTMVVENGYDATGILVCNGRDNELTVSGRVNAGGQGGYGISMRFGSNLLSDLEEYRGSHVRVRSLDYLEGRSSARNAASEQLPDELDGPLVRKLTIDGNVFGKAGAIYIGPLAHVKEISLEGYARVSGGIRSDWAPYFSRDEFLVTPHGGTSHTLAGSLQLKVPVLDDKSAREFRRQHLHTKVYLGARRGEAEKIPDPKARIELNGEVNGSTLDILSVGGHSAINGSVNVPALTVSNSVLTLKTGTSYSTVDNVIMDEHGVLNFVNGAPDRLSIGKIDYIAHGASIRVDADVNGNIREDLSFAGHMTVPSGSIMIEPGLPYTEIKSFNANPREFMRFMENFMANVKQLLGDRSLNVAFPKRIWYEQGDLGMEVKCSARGCRAGHFLSNRSDQIEGMPSWRYSISAVGCILILFFCWMYLSYCKHNGRYRRSEQPQHELTAIVRAEDADR